MEGMQLLLTFLFLVFSIQGSDEPGRIRGRVLTAGGEPRAGAEVVLFSPKVEKVHSAHVLHVLTDSGGRFKASVLPGRRYQVWSVFKDRKGTIFSSQVREDLYAGMGARLREVVRRRPKLLRLTNWKAWEAEGGLVVTWILGVGFEISKELDSRGTSPVPTILPFIEGSARFVVEERGGPQLFTGKVSLGRFQAGGEAYTYPCPKPIQRLVRIVDGRPGGGNAPVPGARLFFRLDEQPWLRGPLSDKDGRVRFKAPSLGGLYTLLYLSGSKAGVGRGHARYWEKEVLIVGRKGNQMKGKVLDLPLVEEEGRPARFIGFDGKGVKGVVFHATPILIIEGRRKGNNLVIPGHPFVRVSGPDGEVPFPGEVSQTLYVNYRFFLPQGFWKGQVPEGFSFPLPRRASPTRFEPFPGQSRIPLGLDLRHSRLLPFRVEGVDGGPLPFVKVTFSEEWLSSSAWEARADRKGRGTLLLGSRGGVLLVFGDEDTYLMEQVPGSSKKGDSSKKRDILLPEKVLRLKTASRFISGKVVDQAGRALPGVRIRIQSWKRGQGGDDLGALLLNEHFLRGRTNGEGKFHLPFFPHPGLSFQLEFSSSSGSALLQVGEPEKDILVRLIPD